MQDKYRGKLFQKVDHLQYRRRRRVPSHMRSDNVIITRPGLGSVSLTKHWLEVRPTPAAKEGLKIRQTARRRAKVSVGT